MNERDTESVHGGGETDAVAALDRLLDAVAAGERPDTDDRLIGLLADARAELDAATSTATVTPPDINALLDAGEGAGTIGDMAPVTPIGRARHRRRRRGLGLTGRAAAAGGLSVTGMVIAGGVAAAIAVGGFGVAAYHGAIPGIPARDEVTDEQNHAPDATPADGSETSRSTTPGASSSTASGARESGTTEPSGTGASNGSDTTGATTETGGSGVPTDGAEPSTEPTEEPGETGTPGEPTGTEGSDEGADPTVTGAPEPTVPSPPSTDKVDDGTTGQVTVAAAPLAGS